MKTDEAVKPRVYRPQLDHATAMRLAATEYQRVIDTLDQLSPNDWRRPTDCPDWDVRAVAGHMLGMTEGAASLASMLRQLGTGRLQSMRRHIDPLDALTSLQVREHADLSSEELVERIRRRAPKAVRGRTRMPDTVRRRFQMSQALDGHDERWTLGFLFDTILTRDPFMHRLTLDAFDFCRILSGRDGAKGTGLLSHQVPF